MSFSTDKIKAMSNRALFTLIDDKRQALERLHTKKLESIKEEVEFCYLVREKQRRFHKPEKHPQCCIN
jgi:hypothetical protein